MFRSTKTTPKAPSRKSTLNQQGDRRHSRRLQRQALDTEQRRAELTRIERFLNNPEELGKKARQEQQTTDRTMRIVRRAARRFLYDTPDNNRDQQTVGKPGDPLVVLNFRPNPRYEPPSRVEQALTGMEGVLLLDTRCHRLASIDGHLFKEVGFGWGILGHLDKGGHFLVQQQENYGQLLGHLVDEIGYHWESSAGQESGFQHD